MTLEPQDDQTSADLAALEAAVDMAAEEHQTSCCEGLVDCAQSPQECADCGVIADARAALQRMKSSVVIIEILGGSLSNVSGLLPGQTYELIDHDEGQHQ